MPAKPGIAVQQVMPSYLFSLLSFSIAASNTDEQTLIARAKANFQADLTAGDTGPYRQSSDFKILLLAGSEGNHLLAGTEGNHFESTQPLANLPADQPTLAQLILVSPDQNSVTYKGQFDQGEFLFSGEATIPVVHTAYLLALNTAEEIDTFKGVLVTENLAQETVASEAPVDSLESASVASESWVWKDDDSWVWRDTPMPSQAEEVVTHFQHDPFSSPAQGSFLAPHMLPNAVAERRFMPPPPGGGVMPPLPLYPQPTALRRAWQRRAVHPGQPMPPAIFPPHDNK